MKIQLKRCRTCKRLGVGPKAVKLLPMNGELYCDEDWRKALDWEEQRGSVVGGIKSLTEFHVEVQKLANKQHYWQRVLHRESPVDWHPYIADLCGLAEFGLVHADKKIFVKYAALAVLAWGLKESA